MPTSSFLIGGQDVIGRKPRAAHKDQECNPLTQTSRGGQEFDIKLIDTVTNYNLLYRFAERFRSGEAQGVADWLKSFDQVNAEDFWSLVWYDSSLKPVAIDQQQSWHYFRDHEVFYWRSDWTKQATAFAFKCGPPEGHHTSALLPQFPDWRLSSGHAHPDANSFIVYARGQYLTGDTGYAGVPMTEHHNTLLVDGKGQAKEGRGHDAFADVGYDRLDRIRIADVKVDKDRVVVTGDATAAYEPELQVKKFVRRFELAMNGSETAGAKRSSNGSGKTKEDRRVSISVGANAAHSSSGAGMSRGTGSARDNAGLAFTVSDDIQVERAVILTSILHSDAGFTRDGKNRFSTLNGGVKLLVGISKPDQLKADVEANTLTAAGPPGSVDKGERQERGYKLLISTSEPATTSQFVMRLRVED